MWRSSDGAREHRLDGWAALAAALLATVGGAGLLAAVLATSSLSGYVSEAGVSGAPAAGLYRLSMLSIAVALGLLALALRGALRLVAVALGSAAPFAGVSAAVTCTPGCPLPPHERPTDGDLWHAGASSTAIALCLLAMLLAARLAEPTDAIRHVAVYGLTFSAPLATAAGLAMLVAGRGLVTGITERAALTSALTWLIVTAVVLAVRTLAKPLRGKGSRSARDGSKASVRAEKRVWAVRF